MGAPLWDGDERVLRMTRKGGARMDLPLRPAALVGGALDAYRAHRAHNVGVALGDLTGPIFLDRHGRTMTRQAAANLVTAVGTATLGRRSRTCSASGRMSTMQPDPRKERPSRPEPDLHRTGGEWRPIDILAGCPERLTETDYLNALGWHKFLGMGAELGPGWYLETWKRSRHGQWEFLLRMGDWRYASPFIQVDSFPELMDLIAQPGSTG